MLRQYGYRVEELPFDTGGNLLLDRDPKIAWAELHPEFFPIEINQAHESALLRVPGIGPSSAATIVQARRVAALRTIDDLRKLGVRGNHFTPYILLNGRQPAHQLRLFT